MAGLKFPIEQDEKYKAQVRFMAKGSGGSFGGIANLYFPEAVSFADGLVYDNANLGIAGEIARKASGGYSTFADEIMGQNIAKFAAGATAKIGEGATSVMDTLGSTQNLKNMVTGNNPTINQMFSLGVQGFTPEPIAAGVAAGTGVTANPHKRSIFKDVALRTFTFSFLMSPQSQAESQAIENIVDFFRENAYPDKILGGFGYKFPTKFYISFFYDGRKMSQAPKILPSYLTSVNTTLNPRSSSFFKDGKANEVQLTMSFQEERALDKDDIKGGY